MTTTRIMAWVLVTLVPGITAMTYVWGFGILWNVSILSVMCLLVEASVLMAKGVRQRQQLFFQLCDGTALVTAWLMAICLPPMTSLPILATAAIAAIGLAKHAYGGMGRNVFNPAMVGYAIVLISFPNHLAMWPALHDVSVDAFSGATLLTDFRYRLGITTTEFDTLFAQTLAHQRLIAFSFLVGGLVLTFKKLLAWRIPAGMFAGVAFCTLFGYDQGSSVSLGSAWFHWMSGGFVAAAFFVATDPVTHPRQARPQILFGFIIGVMIYVVRAYGAFPDGIAFAVLFANCLTPLLNRISARKNLAQGAHG